MTNEEARSLPFGLYKIFWKSGGSSEAAIGQNEMGERWIACTNWFSVPSYCWTHVKSLELLSTNPPAAGTVFKDCRFTSTFPHGMEWHWDGVGLAFGVKVRGWIRDPVAHIVYSSWSAREHDKPWHWTTRDQGGYEKTINQTIDAVNKL